MQDTTKYPQFIPDKPLGKDCFEGHSQDRLAHSVCDYVRRIDAQTAGQGQAVNSMPRIIGLEGGWGTGKSNVVRMIDGELARNGYYTFTYDAWGHQEDLQRRSILETMTSHLIDNGVLQGEVKIKMRNGKVNNDTWKNQLSMLLSNKTTTIKRSVPGLSAASVWGICLVAAFAVMTVVSGLLLDNICGFPVWLAVAMDLVPIFIGVCLSCYYRYKDGNWDRTLKLISQLEDSTVDEEYTSSEEPSVAEFKNWMRAMSDYLATTKQKYHRLIIVFDNMDRLPSEKVMQLWSSIYTFFAGGELANIWTMIPYDYKHLCQAIYGSKENDSEKEKNTERIKQFISKTFPITYHVPQPVITDYRKLFFSYFDMAFGTDVHDSEHICQVFMHLEDNPNPRTVIRFVNELVAIRLQWKGESYRLQNQALYVLKKHWLHYEGQGMEANLLSDDLFDKVSPFYPHKDEVRTELCQYAYGLEDEALASELPLRNELFTRIKKGESIAEYAAQTNFIPVLEKVLNDVDEVNLDNAVKSMASLDETAFTDDYAERIKSKWDMLANKKAESRFEKHQYDETLTALIQHATQLRAVEMARSFAKAMQRIEVKDGAAYFWAQNGLQRALRTSKVTFDDSDWYEEMECSPEQFVNYVVEAKKLYADYGLMADAEELNTYLLNGAKDANEAVATAIDYIKDDDRYDFNELREDLATLITMDEIKDNIYTAAYVHRVLAKDDGVLKVRMKKETISTYLNGDRAQWETHLPKGIEDVMAMSLADGKDQTAIDDELLPRICDCMGCYLDYTGVLQNLGKDDSLFRKLNIYCIEHQRGELLDTKYVACQLMAIQQSLGLDITKLLNQFNRWPVIDWGEISADNEYVKGVRNYVHQSLFTSYRDNPGHFSDSIISLGVQAIEEQKTGFLAIAASRTINSYWKDLVVTFLGTKYMKGAGVMLTNEAVVMLSWSYHYNENREPELLDKIIQYADAATLRGHLHTLMNEQLSKTTINKQRFLRFGRLLPMLGANMDDNTARGLITHFVKPIIKDTECVAVIVEHKNFYLDILRKDTTIAEPIVKEMAAMEGYAEIAEELKTIIA